MKKKLSCLQIVVLILCLCGCGGCALEEGPSFISSNPGVGVSEKQEPSGQKALSGTLKILVPFVGTQVDFWAEKFQSVYPKCKIEVESASNVDDIHTYVQRMAVELMSGDGADIYDVGWLSYYKYAKSNVFENLRTWMEEDPNFDITAYYDNIFRAYEYDGKLIALPTNFSYPMLRLNKNLLGERAENLPQAMNYQELYQLFDTVCAENAGEKINFALPSTTGRAVFDRCEYGKYFDRENLRESFNTAEFIGYLEDTKKYDFGPFGEPVRIADSPSFDGKMYFSNFYFANMDYDEEETETATQQILFHATDGRNVFSEIGNLFSISKAAQEPELAWEFLKFMIEEKPFIEKGLFDKSSENYYKNVDPCIQMMPVNRENYLKRAAYFTKNESMVERWDGINQSLNEAEFNDYQLDKTLSEIKDQFYQGVISEAECAKQLHERTQIYLLE